METNSLIELMEEAEVVIHLIVKDNKLIIIADKNMANEELVETLSMFTSYALLDSIDKPPNSMLQ